MSNKPSDGLLISQEAAHVWKTQVQSLELPNRQTWEKLLFELIVAKACSLCDLEDARLPNGMIEVLRFLNVLSDFIHSVSFVRDNALAAPLLRLQTAINDLASGITPELFIPKTRISGRPPKRTSDSNLMAIVARALDELMKIPDGKSADEKASIIIKVINERFPLLKCEKATVRGWRTRLSAGPAPGVPDMALARWSAPLPPSVGNDPKQRAAFLISLLRNGPALQWV